MIAKGTLGIRESPSGPVWVCVCVCICVCCSQILPDEHLPGVLFVCLANEMPSITLPALLATNQMEMEKLRDDDGVQGIALKLLMVNVKESQLVLEAYVLC